jgi:hypothetical protein
MIAGVRRRRRAAAVVVVDSRSAASDEVVSHALGVERVVRLLVPGLAARVEEAADGAHDVPEGFLPEVQEELLGGPLVLPRRRRGRGRGGGGDTRWGRRRTLRG